MELLDDLLAQCTEVTPLAQGGQKKVLAARHPEFGSVVIKHGEYRTATTLERLSREVELLRQLDSPYYPKHHLFLIEPLRREFLLVEERLPAIELTIAKDRIKTDSAIRAFLEELIIALDVIWSKRVVHRDLKPANILVTNDDHPRIVDLGIARFLDHTSLTATVAGQGPGTAIYASPEQLTNQKAMINIRTDFFLLGLIILELMHGFHPFDPRYVGGPASLVENLLSGNYVPPASDRDPALSQFVSHSLQVKPYKRFRTVSELKSHFDIG